MTASRYQTKRRPDNGLGALAAFALIPLSLVFHGWALKTAWNWFVPSIFALPHLGIAQALGLSIVLGVARPRTSSDSSDDKHWLVRWLSSIAAVLVSLGIGWIVHEVMA